VNVPRIDVSDRSLQSRGRGLWWPGRLSRLLGLAAILANGVSTADIRAELSSDSIRQDETVQLRLEADGANLQPPDLSVLDTDFSIVDRRMQRSRSTINGRRRERVGLTLILLPKRTGSLEIPAISFGTESTRPLKIAVAAPSEQQMPAAPDTGDIVLPQTGIPWSDPYLPYWQPYGSPPPLYSDPIELAPGLIDFPPVAPPPEPAVPTQPEDDSQPAPSAGPTTRERTLQDPWFWTALVLAIALVATLLRRRRARRPAQIKTDTPAQPPVERPIVEPPTIAAIRIAYETGNAAAAQDALLAWGRETFPQDPPANLVRLAKLCDGPAREQITLLEQASYSPTPLQWNRAPIWKWLQDTDH